MSDNPKRRSWYHALYAGIAKMKAKPAADPPALNDEGLRACPNPECRSPEGPTVHHDDYWHQYAGTCSICGTRSATVCMDDDDNPEELDEQAARAKARGHWNALPRDDERPGG